MTTRDKVREVLQSHRSDIDRFGVTKLSIFGSVVRGEERPDSDIDILVEFSDEAKKLGYFRKFMTLALFLENLLGRKVDLATPAMVRRIRSNLDEDLILA